MFLLFPSFQKSLIHSFWPREHEVVLVQCHHVASLHTSPIWPSSWMMITLPCNKFIYHLITLHSLLLLAKHHATSCMHVMYQIFQMNEICFLTKLASHTLLPKPWEMSLSYCISAFKKQHNTHILHKSNTTLHTKGSSTYLDQFSLQQIGTRDKAWRLIYRGIYKLTLTYLERECHFGEGINLGVAGPHKAFGTFHFIWDLCYSSNTIFTERE